MATVEEVGAKIRTSIREARAEGFRIEPEEILIKTDSTKCCCAIGSVVRNTVSEWPYMEAVKSLEIGIHSVLSVARGFDLKLDRGDLKEWHGLGASIRAEVDAGVL